MSLGFLICTCLHRPSGNAPLAPAPTSGTSGLQLAFLRAHCTHPGMQCTLCVHIHQPPISGTSPTHSSSEFTSEGSRHHHFPRREMAAVTKSSLPLPLDDTFVGSISGRHLKFIPVSVACCPSVCSGLESCKCPALSKPTAVPEPGHPHAATALHFPGPRLARPEPLTGLPVPAPHSPARLHPDSCGLRAVMNYRRNIEY